MYSEFLDEEVLAYLDSDEGSIAHPSVPGLRTVHGVPLDVPDFSADALSFTAAVCRAARGFSPSLQDVLADRRARRAAVDTACDAASASQRTVCSVPYGDGSRVCLALREDTASIRSLEWCVRAPPAFLDRFQDTITGPATGDFVWEALSCGVHFAMVDLEDSSTVGLQSLVDGLRVVREACHRTLLHPLTQQLLPAELAALALRVEGLHLPNAHFLLDGEPMPAHLLSAALFLYHNHVALAETGHAPVLYLPKLESYEEGLYWAQLLHALEQQLPPSYVRGTLRVFFIMENVHGAFEREEILYALRDFAVGVTAGWHDYTASAGAALGRLAAYAMPPKANLAVVASSLEAYQLAIYEVCERRGAIPVGGMNGMVPPHVMHPRGWHDLARCEAMAAEAFARDFAVQAKRGLRGMWLAHPMCAQRMNVLVAEWEANDSPAARAAARPGLLAKYAAATQEQLVVATAEPGPVPHCDVLLLLRDALQYLAAYLSGTGCVGLTRSFEDGTPVRLLDDAATLERSRREVWALLHHGRGVLRRDVRHDYMPTDLAEDVSAVLDRIVKTGEADVPCTLDTKISYDLATEMVLAMCTAERPPAYFTELALAHMLQPFHNDPTALAVVRGRRKHAFLREAVVSAGAQVVFVTNESFAPATNLLKSSYPRFRPHCWDQQGQVYDGWESVRHNSCPPDYAELELAAPAVVGGANIATTHFNGNHAIGAAVLAEVSTEVDRRLRRDWLPLIPQTPLNGNADHFVASVLYQPVRRVRLQMFPDGGIARLRLYGTAAAACRISVDAEASLAVRTAYLSAIPKVAGFPVGFVPPANSATDVARIAAKVQATDRSVASGLDFGTLEDLGLGSEVLASSSARYSVPSHMFQPGRGINMGDGWETARMRSPDVFELRGAVAEPYNWTVAMLARPGAVLQVGVDTLHFKNNSPVAVCVETAQAPGLQPEACHMAGWRVVLPPSLLRPNDEHLFEVAADAVCDATHILVKIFPCGGLSRLRLYGKAAAGPC